MDGLTVGYDDGMAVTFQADHEGLSIMAEEMLAAFNGAGGVNYVCWTATHPTAGEFILTLQRKNGLTPDEKAVLMQSVVDAAAAFYDAEFARFNFDGTPGEEYTQLQEAKEDAEQALMEAVKAYKEREMARGEAA